MVANKKHNIKLESFLDFYVLGISSSETDFKLCWRINEALNINFKRDKNLIIFNKKHKIEQEFSLYSLVTENYSSFLISNKSSNGYLIEEHKTIDFFLKISSQDNTIVDDFYSKLNSINQIQAVFKLDINSLKSKQNLVFDSQF